jgi:hypothetical protein
VILTKDEISIMSSGNIFKMLKLRINQTMIPHVIEDGQVYNRTCLFEAEVAAHWSIESPARPKTNDLSIHDSEVIQVGLGTSANTWAIQNCLNETVYIFKSFDNYAFSVKLIAKVYLTDEQITFWRLKCNS